MNKPLTSENKILSQTAHTKRFCFVFGILTFLFCLKIYQENKYVLNVQRNIFDLSTFHFTSKMKNNYDGWGAG